MILLASVVKKVNKMGRYHFFGCKKCKKQGGLFEIFYPGTNTVPKFKYINDKEIEDFLKKHLLKCGVKNIIIFDEHCEEYGEYTE